MRKGILLLLALACLCASSRAQEPLKIFVNGALATSTNVNVYGDSYGVTMTGFAGGHIFYTTNGTAPTVAGAEYSTGLGFTTNATIRAVAYDAAFAESRTGLVSVVLDPVRFVRLSGPVQYIEYSTNGADFAKAPLNGLLYVGSTQTLSLRPAPTDGWFFDRWKGLKGTTSVTNSFQVDRTFEVHLSVYRTNEISVPVIGDGQVTVSPPPPYYWDNPNVQITAVPDAENFFAGWNLPQSEPKSISFTQRVDVTPPTATFSPLLEGTFSISVKIDGQGTVLAPTRYFAAAGSTVQVTVQPPVGWNLTNWTGDASGPGTASNNPYGRTVSVTMDASKSVTAHMEKLVQWTPSPVTGLSLGWDAIAPDGTIIMAGFTIDDTDHVYIVAFDEDGFEKWELPTRVPSKYAFSGLFIGPDGIIYELISSIVGPYLQAISSDGNFLWRKDGGAIYVYAAVSEKGVYMSASNSGRYVNRYDSEGTLLDEAHDGAFHSYKGLILDADSNPLLGGQEFISYTSELEPRYKRAGGGLPAFADLNGNMFSSDLQAIKPDGTRLWTNGYTNGIPLCLSTNRIYIIDNDGGKLSALDLATGAKLWALNEPYAGVSVNGGAVAEDDYIYALFTGGLLRKISPSGDIVWEIRSSGGVPLITPDGLLYVGLTGFDIGAGPAKSGFPMSRADSRNSGAAYTGLTQEFNTLGIEFGPSGLVLTFVPSTSGVLALQWSDDLITWNNLQSFSGALSYTIPTPLETHRFYRVVTP